METRGIFRIRPGCPLCILLAVLFLPHAVPAASPITEHRLPNGLKVLILEDHKAPIVSFQVWVRVGSRWESPGKTGLSHLMEHMMFKGTRRTGPEEFSRIVQKNGGVNNAYTSQDHTVYYENIAADRLDLVMGMEADRMRNLILNEREFEGERNVVMEERRMRYEDDPVNFTAQEMMAAAFKVHPYRLPVIGWMDDIAALRLSDLRQWYRSYYVPNRVFLVVAGDVVPAKVLALARKHFGGIPRGTFTSPAIPREPEQTGERRVMVRREAKLPFVFAGYHTPNHTHPDSASLEVLATVLSGGKSSRLYRALITGKQLALSAAGSYDRVSLDPGLFYVWAEALPGTDAKKLETELFAEIEALKREPVDPEELEKAKTQIEADLILGQDSVIQQGMQLGEYESCSSWKDRDRFLPAVRAVTAGDVQRAARTYLTEDHRTVAVLLPKGPKTEAP